MAIGRSEDRKNPWNPAMLRHHVPVWDPIRETHLGQRSCRPHHKGRTYDRNRPDPFPLQTPCDPGAVHIWLMALLARKPKKLAAVALANKMARTLWAMMVSGQTYRQPKEA